MVLQYFFLPNYTEKIYWSRLHLDLWYFIWQRRDKSISFQLSETCNNGRYWDEDFYDIAYACQKGLISLLIIYWKLKFSVNCSNCEQIKSVSDFDWTRYSDCTGNDPNSRTLYEPKIIYSKSEYLNCTVVDVSCDSNQYDTIYAAYSDSNNNEPVCKSFESSKTFRETCIDRNYRSSYHIGAIAYACQKSK